MNKLFQALIISLLSSYNIAIYYTTNNSQKFQTPELGNLESSNIKRLIKNNSIIELSQTTPKKNQTSKKLDFANTVKLELYDKTPTLKLSNNGKAFSFTLQKDSLQIDFQDRKLINISKDSVSFQNLIFSMAQPVIKGDFKAHGQKMWKIVTNTFFNGYLPTEITNCKGTTMFGGPGKLSKNELKMTFYLPKHTRVKVQLTYHFLDLWNGNVGYQKYEDNEGKQHWLWIRKQNSNGIVKTDAVTICSAGPDAHFSQNVEVAFGHNQDKIKLIIGSSQKNDDPSIASYGVSNIQLYTI